MSSKVCLDGYDFALRAIAARDAQLQVTEPVDMTEVPTTSTIKNDTSSFRLGSSSGAHRELSGDETLPHRMAPNVPHLTELIHSQAGAALELKRVDSPTVLTVTSMNDVLSGSGFTSLADVLRAHDSKQDIVSYKAETDETSHVVVASAACPSFSQAVEIVIDNVTSNTPADGGNSTTAASGRADASFGMAEGSFVTSQATPVGAAFIGDRSLSGVSTDSAVMDGFVRAEDGKVKMVLPAHFGVVEPGIYRGAFPSPATYPFLKAIGVRTVINLLDRLPIEYASFMAAQHITYHHLAVKGNKEHCEEMDRGKVKQALYIMMDIRNHPVLLHCRSGKHRTGALVGCLRMVCTQNTRQMFDIVRHKPSLDYAIMQLQGQSLEDACVEYVEYCQHKQREVDKQFIERFDPRTLADDAPSSEYFPAWLPADCCNHPSKWQDAMDRRTPSNTSSGRNSVENNASAPVVSAPSVVSASSVAPAAPSVAPAAPVAVSGAASAATSRRPTVLRNDKGLSPFDTTDAVAVK